MTERELQPRLSGVELALNLNRIYAVVNAYPNISQVEDVEAATRDEVVAGYERIVDNRHLGGMCLQAERRLRAENKRVIAALEEMTSVAS